MKADITTIHDVRKAIDYVDKLNKQMKGNEIVKVGLPKNSNAYPDGTSVVMVGVINEFGYPPKNIPQRSYLRSTVNSGKKKYAELFQKLARAIVEGKKTKNEALAILGLQLQTDVRQTITDIRTPPLKRRKGNPLVDTGHLRQSITYVIGEE